MVKSDDFIPMNDNFSPMEHGCSRPSPPPPWTPLDAANNHKVKGIGRSQGKDGDLCINGGVYRAVYDDLN
jgi:hypothetical protein